jgi:hypothetical protein
VTPNNLTGCLWWLILRPLAGVKTVRPLIAKACNPLTCRFHSRTSCASSHGSNLTAVRGPAMY